MSGFFINKVLAPSCFQSKDLQSTGSNGVPGSNSGHGTAVCVERHAARRILPKVWVMGDNGKAQREGRLAGA